MKAFALKILLLLAIILPIPTSSRAYSLLDDNIRLATQNDQMARNSNYQFSDENTYIRNNLRKSPALAFALAASPIFLSTLVWFTVGNDESDERNAIALGISSLLFIFGTIPAHIYSEDSNTKTSIIILAKVGGALVTGFGIVGIISEGLNGMCFDNCEEKPGEHDNTAPIVVTALGSAIILGTYIYELIDAPLSASRYNKGHYLNLTRTLIIPTATKDRVGLALQVNF